MEYFEKEDKAGYNQAGRIVEILGFLRCTYTACMMSEDFKGALEAIRSKLTVISGKVKEEDIDEMNELIYVLEDKITVAESTFIHEGKEHIKFPLERKNVKRLLENLGRKLEKLEDKYGYGMVSQEDPRMAVLQT